MPAFPHERLTDEQYVSCQRFHLKVFGTLMFLTGPVCDGKHGWGCDECHRALIAVEREKRRLQREAARVAAIPQPWGFSEAA